MPCPPTEFRGPLLIVGCQRSGTTLLRTMLTAHRNIAIGYECDFFEALAPRYGRMADLLPVWRAFVRDLQAVNRFAFWGLDRSDLYTALQHRTAPLPYADAVRLVGETYLRKTKPQARIYGFKNPNSVERLDQFVHLFPDAKVLHITRDPRAVLASQLTKARRRGHANGPLKTVRTGRRIGRAQRALDQFAEDPRVLQVSYSDLVNDPAQHLQQICDWLGVEMDATMLDYHRSADTPEAEMWQHALTRTAPRPSRATAYRTVLTPLEMAAIGWLCRRDMARASDGWQGPHVSGFATATYLMTGWVSWAVAGAVRRGRRYLTRRAVRPKGNRAGTSKVSTTG